MDTPWTPEEIEEVLESIAGGESAVEVWRHTHRAVDTCRELWRNVLSKDYYGPLSQDEQAKLLFIFCKFRREKFHQSKGYSLA